MSNSNAFALKNSGLNDFLFAEVGSEINGSRLTILSMLARLGKDPWAEAARLARLPKSSTIDDLANSISKMPLGPQALTDARSTAARVMLLLPSQVQSISGGASQPAETSAVPPWIPLAAFLALIAFGIVFQAVAPAPSASTVTHSVVKTVAHPHAPTN
jgi:hypothetical protein